MLQGSLPGNTHHCVCTPVRCKQLPDCLLKGTRMIRNRFCWFRLLGQKPEEEEAAAADGAAVEGEDDAAAEAEPVPAGSQRPKRDLKKIK